MSKSWRRFQKAASPHKRAHWHMQRVAASSPAYTVDDADGAWYVTDGSERVAGPFDSSSGAWSWIDGKTTERRYGADSDSELFYTL
jgi:hypothetical protein